MLHAAFNSFLLNKICLNQGGIWCKSSKPNELGYQINQKNQRCQTNQTNETDQTCQTDQMWNRPNMSDKPYKWDRIRMSDRQPKQVRQNKHSMQGFLLCLYSITFPDLFYRNYSSDPVSKRYCTSSCITSTLKLMVDLNPCIIFAPDKMTLLKCKFHQHLSPDVLIALTLESSQKALVTPSRLSQTVVPVIIHWVINYK